MCKFSDQFKTLLNQDSFSAFIIGKLLILASLPKPTGVKGAIYIVPLNNSNEELPKCLKEQPRFVKRFQTKSLDSDKNITVFDLITVLLHFSCSVLPNFVSLYYLRFNIKQCKHHNQYVVSNVIDLATLL